MDAPIAGKIFIDCFFSFRNIKLAQRSLKERQFEFVDVKKVRLFNNLRKQFGIITVLETEQRARNGC